MVKIKANHKVTQREILKYHICEHHKVGYEALEKLCEKQQKTLIKRDQVIERLSKNIEYNQNQLAEWRTNQKNWVSKISQELIDKANNHNQAMEEQKTHYEKELKELGDLYDKAVEHNKEMVKVNQDCLETNRDILRDHNEITRAYNGLHHMGKFAEELGIDIKKHNAMLPENDEYNQFTQKHQLLESGKVRHTWTLKKKKKEKKNDTN